MRQNSIPGSVQGLETCQAVSCKYRLLYFLWRKLSFYWIRMFIEQMKSLLKKKKRLVRNILSSPPDPCSLLLEKFFRLHQGGQSQEQSRIQAFWTENSAVTVVAGLLVKTRIFAPMLPSVLHRVSGLFWWWIYGKEMLTVNAKNFCLPERDGKGGAAPRPNLLARFAVPLSHCPCSPFWPLTSLFSAILFSTGNHTSWPTFTRKDVTTALVWSR